MIDAKTMDPYPDNLKTVVKLINQCYQFAEGGIQMSKNFDSLNREYEDRKERERSIQEEMKDRQHAAALEFFEAQLNDIILVYCDWSIQDRRSPEARKEAKEYILEALKNV
jgi:hypothetical protein